MSLTRPRDIGGHRLSEQRLHHQGCGKAQWQECQFCSKGEERDIIFIRMYKYG